MFQKLKDKLTEDVKKSSLKFPVSVQQITQAVSSTNSPSKIVSSDPTESEEKDTCKVPSDEVTSNSDYDSSFTTIDLRSPTPAQNRRSSSSDLFPIYEFLPARRSLQSDLESNSEFDDGSSIHQFTNVSKEILYEKYRNMLQKCHKYRGRYADMRKYCQELEREHEKIKNVLTETQDKAIRRTKELKEQCALEQTAKAHLESVLRNELEERDFIISTLNTKIKLLRNKKDQPVMDEQQQNISDSLKGDCDKNQAFRGKLCQEVELLKDKIKNFELLLNKAKEAITNKNMKIRSLEAKIESEKNELRTSNAHMAQLQHKIDLMRLKEEEALLSLAENKMMVHKELEAKEKHIKILEDQINQFESEKEKLKIKEQTDTDSTAENVITAEEIDPKDSEIERLKNELKLMKKDLDKTDFTPDEKLRNQKLSDQSNLDFEEMKKLTAAVELYQNKVEEQEATFSEKQKRFDSLLHAKDDEIARLTEISACRDNDVLNLKTKILQLEKEASDNRKIREEIISLNDLLCQVRETVNEKDNELETSVEKISKLESELSAVKNKLFDATRYKKMWEELVTSSKADKIISEEMMKNVRNELNVTQADLKDANNKIEKYESQLKNKIVIENEKLDFERQLLEHQNNLRKLTSSLEQSKEKEHQMHLQIANLLEEINKLKAKEDEYLNDIRKLKDDLSSLKNVRDEVESLNADLKKNQVQSEELSVENELIRNENIRLKEKIEELKNYANKLEESLIEKEILLQNYSSSTVEQEDMAKLIENLKKLAEENTSLKLNLEELSRSNEEIIEKNGNLTAENRLIHETIDSLKQAESVRIGHFENLKKACELNAQSLEEHEIYQAVIEKLRYYIEKNFNIQKENERLNHKINQTKMETKENENYRKQIETLCLQKKCLEDKLTEQCNEFDKLLLQCDKLGHNRVLNVEFKQLNEQITGEFEKKLDEQEASTFLKNENISCAKITSSSSNQTIYEKLVSDLIASETNMGSLTKDEVSQNVEIVNDSDAKKNMVYLPEFYQNAIVYIHSQLLDLKIKNVEMKNELLNFMKFLNDPSISDELCFKRLVKVICAEKQVIRNEFLSLKKEKEELLMEVKNLMIEMDEMHKQCEQKIQQQELVFKEKYAQEMQTVVAGYEASLIEKDNEYEALHNKLNLRRERDHAIAYQETKDVIENLQEELTTRQDSYTELLIKHENVVEEHNNRLSELKDQYAKELRENDKKWRSCLDKKIEEVEEKYKEEITELTKEWTIDRKFFNTIAERSDKDGQKFLEDSVKHSENSEALIKQVQVLTDELNNYKKNHWREVDLNLMNVSYNNDLHLDMSLEDCTEMEYLRNILFKYMMGHQPMILAKVLAAVVKFDNHQTQQILQREEQKQSLMGHFGLT